MQSFPEPRVCAAIGSEALVTRMLADQICCWVGMRRICKPSALSRQRPVEGPKERSCNNPVKSFLRARPLNNRSDHPGRAQGDPLHKIHPKGWYDWPTVQHCQTNYHYNIRAVAAKIKRCNTDRFKQFIIVKYGHHLMCNWTELTYMYI